LYRKCSKDASKIEPFEEHDTDDNILTSKTAVYNEQNKNDDDAVP
jgi:hypothetical protein